MKKNQNYRSKEDLYYKTMEHLYKAGFNCDCNPSNPAPGCIICDPREHESIRKDPVWLEWIKKD